MMEVLNNPFIVIPFFSWFIAQVIKFAITAFKGSVDFRQFYQSGGMPSGHTATVTSLLVVTFIVEGIGSPLLGIVAILATIVIYDSLGVRYATGVQADYIEKIINKLEIKHDEPVVSRLSHGHTPMEVFSGGLLGLFLGLLLTAEYWIENAKFLIAPRSEAENLAYSVIFSFLTAVGFYLIVSSNSRINRRIPSRVTLKHLAVWLILLPAIGGNIIIWLGQQGVDGLETKLASLSVVAILITVNIFAYIKFYRFLGSKVLNEKKRLRFSTKKPKTKSHKKRKKK